MERLENLVGDNFDPIVDRRSETDLSVMIDILFAGQPGVQDSDCPNPSDRGPSAPDPGQPRLRYDGPHPEPPAPMFVRLDVDPPSDAEEL